MSDAIVGLFGALVGGSAALAGAALQARTLMRTNAAERADAAHRWREEQSRAVAERHRLLARRYLYQLQDALDSLSHRLRNWAHRGGEQYSESKDPGYWEVTTLYAVARALAADRILVLEGVYPELNAVVDEPERRLKPRELDGALGRVMGNDWFFYHRLALAEAALDRSADGFRLLTYSEFRRRYDDPEWNLQSVAARAIEAFGALSRADLEALEDSLAGLSARVAAVMPTPSR
jgi:hypothetical protein